jgi:SAM-dependent methyltransferase
VWLFTRYLEFFPGTLRMAETQARSLYAGTAEYWNSPATRPWAEQHERQDRALAGLATAALALAAPQPGERALDIGCGSGTTVLELAAQVGPSGYVLGADISRRSAARARERIAGAGLVQAEVVCADVATHPFPAAGFDLAFSRLGVMFFDDPTSAFQNVRRAVRPGGRLALAVFRTPRENPWPNAPLEAVRHLLPPMITPGPDEPGMFSWSDPARVHRILEGAGFREISLSPVEVVMQLAGSGGAAEAAEFAMLFGPLTRILPGLPSEQHQALRSALETFFQSHATQQGVALPAAFWVVQAKA